MYFVHTLGFALSKKAGVWWYRQTYFLIIADFLFIIYSNYLSPVRTKSFAPVAELLYDGNIQYLVVAVLWFVFEPFFGTLPPFFFFSLTHVLSYLQSTLLPIAGYPINSPHNKTLQAFVANNTDMFMTTVANIEFFLLIRLTLYLFTFRVQAFIKFAVYLIFFRLRYQTSAFTYRVIQSWEVFIDRTLSNPNVPFAIKEGWVTCKGYARNIFGTLLGGPQGYHAGMSAEEKRR